MKKRLMIPLAAVIVFAIVFCILWFGVWGERVSEGKYYIKEYPKYPNAYIEVKDNTVQFFGIDLDAEFHDILMKVYETNVRLGDPELDVDDLNELISMNSKYCDQPFSLKNALVNHTDTFIYMYDMCDETYIAGLLIRYNAFHKTLEVSAGSGYITFEK